MRKHLFLIIMKIVSEGKEILMVLKIEEADIGASWMAAHNRLYEFKSWFCNLTAV